MPRSSEVCIDSDMLARIEALPDRRSGARLLMPTPTQLEALRRYWRPVGAEAWKAQEDIAEAIGVSVNTARKWYRKYIEGKE
jgi:hypothetical protein